MGHSKLMNPAQAAALIQDGRTVVVEGAGRLLLSEAILSALERRFLETGKPEGLALIQACGFGNDGDAGASHFAHAGLVKRVISPGWGDSPRMAQLALANQVEAYCFPQGVVGQMIWASACRNPRVISHVGLGTFVDPRQDGGKMNAVTHEDLVEVIELDGAEWLTFRVLPIDVAIIRGTTADEFGNISMEHEPVILEPLAMALAAHASGGLVLAEVKRLVRRGSLHPQAVKVPGILVDGVVVNPDAWQIHEEVRYNPAFSGEARVPVTPPADVEISGRMVVARRAAMELFPGAVINIGFGISDGVPIVAAQEGLVDDLIFTVEQGTIGGTPQRGRVLAAQINPEVIIDQLSQFALYQGGGLDLAFLSFAQLDREGNVNVSKFGKKLPGCGGFIDISENAKRVVFCALFSQADAVRVEDGAVRVISRGSFTKFPKRVEQVTFNGPRALRRGQPAIFVTERAVFGLGPRGVEVLEIAPGSDLERDVLDGMAFRPAISAGLRTMPPEVFRPTKMGLRQRWTARPESSGRRASDFGGR
jgi:propionate CoA-transferase